MTETSALRFDIYEKINLSDNAAAIKEFEEMELTPHIQVLTREEQVILKGNLYFEARYSGDIPGNSHLLEHFIPVEITLPAYRVRRLEDITVAVENFDVEIVSAHRVNVTGVLRLSGIVSSAVQSGQEALEKPFEEQVADKVFIHEFDEDTHAVKEISANAAINALEFRFDTLEKSVEERQQRDNVQGSDEGETPDVKDIWEESRNTWPEEREEAEAQVETSAGEGFETDAEPNITFKSKPTEDFDFSPTVNREPEDTGAIPAGEMDFAESETASVSIQQPDEAKRDDLKWKNLFLSSASSEPSFKKLKICIVQKEETLESIAQKYNVNPREIMLYNRLGDQEVTQGQVLYIPK